ncbi:MAG: hypothetical protein D6785_06055 [Planctomycetota bacterium]|nr:MAG: hypothetical protein D6785_06055 [Planctomycetota bacterium]
MFMNDPNNIYPNKLISILFLICFASSIAFGCKKNKGPEGYVGPQGPTGFISIVENLPEGSDLPGLNVEILEVSGGSGWNGNVLPGDTISVRFRITTDQGVAVPLGELDYGGILVSGPTFNYQRVIPLQTDLLSQSHLNSDDTWTYTFKTPIPNTYLPPLNDSTNLDRKDGELQGHPLFSGTYTVGIEVYKIYNVGTKVVKDVGNGTKDFLLGIASTLDTREVVLQSNCNQCHHRLQAHDGIRQNVTLCLLCHTAGAEDENNPALAGGTPGVSIEFRVMIHKIHNGKHLPSVNGVTTNPDGTRNYNASPVPYQIAADGKLHDFSDVAFPEWPNRSYPMPKDKGYSSLTANEQAKEDIIRKGVTDCDKCHGGASQGALAYQIYSRNACGACHDDIRWDYNYSNNGMTMPPRPKSYSCYPCHDESPAPGSLLPTRDLHKHPMLQDAKPNLNFIITSLQEAGTHNNDGTIDSGEKISITFDIQDDQGQPVNPSEITEAFVAINGPVINKNLILYTKLPLNALSGSSPYTINIPQNVYLEYVGDSTPSNGDIFTTSLTPHWNLSGAETALFVRTGTGTATTLAQDAKAGQNYLVLASVAGFNNGDYIVVDDGVAGKEEYLRIKWVDTANNKVWFGSPYTAFGAYPPLRLDHLLGATVQKVTLTLKTEGVDYTLDKNTGTITETAEFGGGNAVLVSYTTDFVMPSKYPLVLNDTGSFDETWGKWTGKSIVSGTYRLGIWGYRTYNISLQGETNTYYSASKAGLILFKVGNATNIQTNDIVSEDKCNACHTEIIAHGGKRRGLETCLFCHGNAGVEDQALYEQTTPDPINLSTPNTVIDFRTLLHKIHGGSFLTQTYKVVSEDKIHTYNDVVFPAMPGGIKHCDLCHLSKNGTGTWEEPQPRIHPTEQTLPSRVWKPVCGSCHDSVSAQNHIDLMTQSGNETCSLCHSQGKSENIKLKHKNYTSFQKP